MAEQPGIQELSLETVLGDRFGRYSKYIIQDRALPDIRDGLKPVQRRILYAMNKEGNTSTKPFRKSAKTVGNVIGNYHPHGDTSVYEAMVRLSQDWKNREPLVEMHGNNGSMDGDPAAAMRYTEARLSKIAEELLKDIDKDTVAWVLNFDDTEEEPTVLPAAYPNLLVNGATGISAGYATDIPTHNLGEVVDATKYLIDHPNASLEKLMSFVPGPDFPTGAIIQGRKGLEEAYKTGKGKVVVRSRYEVVTLRSGREQILISEIPYDVNKAKLVQQLDAVRANKDLDGINEVRDESDRDGLQIAIDLKKDANADAIINYLLKNTDLQVNYHFNMIAIHNHKPELVGLKEILTAYIDHRINIIEKRTQFDLNKAQNRVHIVDGLIKAVSILDEVIAMIRSSKNKSDSKENLIKGFNFTEEQAEAIVTLQLYRLSNTDIVELENEKAELDEKIKSFQAILDDEKILMKVIKDELTDIKKNYTSDRRSTIEDKVEEIKIEKELLIANEDVLVTVTKQGYMKQTSLRSYQASEPNELGLREGDKVIFAKKQSTLDAIVMMTNQGRYAFMPINELPDIRWKDMGHHLSQNIVFLPNEEVIAVQAYEEDTELELLFSTRFGQIKRTKLAELTKMRGYRTKMGMTMRLNEGDEILTIQALEKPISEQAEVLLITKDAFALRYPLEEVPLIGNRTKGVKSINLREDDQVVSTHVLTGTVEENNKEQVTILTQRGFGKRTKLDEISPLSRAKRGILILKTLKTSPHEVVYTSVFDPENTQLLVQTTRKEQESYFNEWPLSARTTNGKQVIELDESEIFVDFGKQTTLVNLI